MKKIFIALTVIFAGVAAMAQDSYTNDGMAYGVAAVEQQGAIIDMSFATESCDVEFFALSDEERAEKIDIFLAQNRKYLPKNKVASIRETLMGLSETKLKSILMSADDEFKNPTTALVLSIFLGGLGVDRFYVGDAGLGVLKLITVGGMGIWTVVDWFVIQKRTRNNNYKELMELCRTY